MLTVHQDRPIDFTSLMKAAGIDASGSIRVDEKMSGLEPNPKDDWLYLGLLSLKDIASRYAREIRSAACIGSANGIDAIATLKLFPELRIVYITDILEEILPKIRRNVDANLGEISRDIDLQYVAGRDCEPLTAPVDLIYANLPLVMVEAAELQTDLATTTLTDAQHYLKLGKEGSDPLLQWSLLSQLGFLLSAAEKLNPAGKIITLIGGRVPYEVIEMVFARAGLGFKQGVCAFKKQSDPQFIKEYADLEKKVGVTFDFYEYSGAETVIRDVFNVVVPDVIPAEGENLKQCIKGNHLSATQAYEVAKKGGTVGHIAYAWEAWKI